MSNLTKLEFVTLDISGKNYLSWILDVQIHLDAMGLGDTIKEKNDAPLQDKANAMIFLRRHLSEELKNEYLTEKDPLCLWNNLKDRYDHQKTVILPKARADWLQLRLQDFKTVAEYNSALFKISSTLKLCGDTVTDELLLEKTFTTFHASNVLLQQQYRERHWQNICRTPKHLADLYQASIKEKGKQKEMNFLDHDEQIDTTNLEMNFINHDEPVNITNLDVSDFFDDRDEMIDFLIGDGNVHTS
ncbi:uncharacterized protein LOC132280514 [Cornus florida]|uniref:uncharacterized protein LOC132280514 n=1 Tax=Cornus florida TaxID=4283 RepID=UPI00289FAE62|nr:uncharacterized protein LOC132280514 [Cornus florida]